MSTPTRRRGRPPRGRGRGRQGGPRPGPGPVARGPARDDARPGRPPERVERTDGFERWHGGGALGYLDPRRGLRRARRRSARARAGSSSRESCFPTGVLGAWARRLADAGLVAVVTATSPRRLPHPDGGPPLTGTNPIAIAVPVLGRPAVRRGRLDGSRDARRRPRRAARRRGARPVRRPRRRTRRSRSPAGVELLVGALAGPEHGAVVLAARPDHDPVPAFRELAAGLRLPGDA